MSQPTASLTGARESKLSRAVDEFMVEFRLAHNPDVEAFANRYPDIADELRRVLPALAMLRSSEPRPNDLGPELESGILGDFRLIREVGRGGMGIVYEAEQISLNRKVALKVLPFAATMDPRQLQRFRNEAQAAACLHHANIVPVHGVGCDRGVHYYAMQLIEGQTLAEVIQSSRERERPESGRASQRERDVEDLQKVQDSHVGLTPRRSPSTAPIAALSTKRDRARFRSIAELIASAADALEYAHSMGVVHRDIKPGNLMLDNAGHLWITDFGLAKLANPAREGGGEITMTGDLIGTLRYMSPEQALAKHGLVDHRTDIYSLGATLYELLTLHPAVQGADKAQILKAIAWDDSTPLRKLDKSIPAELETITLKCLAKEPGERYATAGEVADDLRRWLGDHAIKAKPLGWKEKTAKWGRRHRIAVRSALAVAGVAMLALVVSNVLITEEKCEKEQALEMANKRMQLIEKGNRFLASVFKDLNPLAEEHSGKPLRVLLGERLDQALDQVEGEAAGDDLAAAKLQCGLAEAYLGLGNPDKAIAIFSRVRATYASVLPPDHPEMLEVMDNLGLAYRDARKYDEALRLIEESFKRSKITRGIEHSATITSMNNLGVTLESAGRTAEAVPILEEALRLSRIHKGPKDPGTLVTMSSLAAIYSTNGRLADSIPLAEEALRLHKAERGPDHVRTLDLATNLAYSYMLAGRLNDALDLAKDTLARTQSKLGPNHRDTLGTMKLLARVYTKLGWLDKALPLFEETLRLSKIHLGSSPPDPLGIRNDFALALTEAGRANEAVSLLEAMVQDCKASAGANHPNTLAALHNLALACHAANKLEAALQHAREALQLRRLKLRNHHPDTVQTMRLVALIHRDLEQYDQAKPLFEEAIRARTATLGPEHADTLDLVAELATNYAMAKKFDQAVPLYEQALKPGRPLEEILNEHGRLNPAETADVISDMLGLSQSYRETGQVEKAAAMAEEIAQLLPNVQPKPANYAFLQMMTESAIARAYQAEKKFDLAVPHLENALKVAKENRGPDDPITFRAMAELAQAYAESGRFGDSARLHRESIAILRRKLPADHPQLAANLAVLGLIELQSAQPKEAEKILREALTIREKKEPENWTTFNTKSLLGGALLYQKRYAEAEPLLLQGYQGMKLREVKIPPQGKVRVTEALERLVQIYEATDKKDLAAEWRKKLDATREAAKKPAP